MILAEAETNKSEACFYEKYVGYIMVSIQFSFSCFLRRKNLGTYCAEIKKLAMKILGHMAQGLKMDAEEMKELFGDGVQSVRMNYYPPCPEPDKAIGFSPHSDAVALTILLQLNETEGLQIRKDGRWIPVKPLPNAFVVNIGDIMEVPFY